MTNLKQSLTKELKNRAFKTLMDMENGKEKALDITAFKNNNSTSTDYQVKLLKEIAKEFKTQNERYEKAGIELDEELTIACEIIERRLQFLKN